jgi:hypothetical protein
MLQYINTQKGYRKKKKKKKKNYDDKIWSKGAARRYVITCTTYGTVVCIVIRTH